MDDEPLNLLVLANLLDSFNVPYQLANNGKQAIDAIYHRLELIKTDENVQMFKLILLDYSMSDLDGPDVAKVIRTTLLSM